LLILFEKETSAGDASEHLFIYFGFFIDGQDWLTGEMKPDECCAQQQQPRPEMGERPRKRIRKNQVLSINSRNRVGQPHRQPHGTYPPSSSASLVRLNLPPTDVPHQMSKRQWTPRLYGASSLCYALAVIESSSGRPALPIRSIYSCSVRIFKRLSCDAYDSPFSCPLLPPPSALLFPLPNLKSIMLLETF
jgi:hypothetical protein